MTCNASGTAYGACLGDILPAVELCGDGLDTDCDGLVDDGCICTPYSATSCYSGPPATAGVGACTAGTQTCNIFGTAWGACTGDVIPTPEVCGDSIDNDCDGTLDEGCIGDRAWRDADGNGIQDGGEVGVAGVTFLLRLTATGALVAVAVSDAAGTYYFSNVPAGGYYIEVVPPVGFTLTVPNVGSDASDSDFDNENLVTAPFSFTAADYSIDCGL